MTTTLEQREYAGVNSVAKQNIPANKRDLSYRDKERDLALEKKAIRELDNPMVEYNYHKKLTDVLGNPRDNIMKQINAGNYKIITNEEAMHVPYRRAPNSQ